MFWEHTYREEARFLIHACIIVKNLKTSNRHSPALLLANACSASSWGPPVLTFSIRGVVMICSCWQDRLCKWETHILTFKMLDCSWFKKKERGHEVRLSQSHPWYYCLVYLDLNGLAPTILSIRYAMTSQTQESSLILHEIQKKRGLFHRKCGWEILHERLIPSHMSLPRFSKKRVRSICPISKSPLSLVFSQKSLKHMYIVFSTESCITNGHGSNRRTAWCWCTATGGRP